MEFEKSHLSVWTKRLHSADPERINMMVTLADKIKKIDFKKNEIVCLKIENIFAFATAYFTTLEMGAVPLVMPPSMPIPNDCLPRYLITENSIEALNPVLLLSKFPNCFATLSSGSVGEPKIYFHSVEAAKTNARIHASGLGLLKEHLIIQTLPVFHIFGIIAYLWTPIVIGCQAWCQAGFYGLREFTKIKNDSCVIHLTPYLLEVIKKDSFAYNKFFSIVSVGAGVLSPKLAEFVKSSLAKNLFITYGLTEAGPRVSCKAVTSGQYVECSLGYPLQQIDTKVFNDGKISDTGYGVLAIKSPCIALNLVNSVVDDYLITTDLVKIDATKEIIFQGRKEGIFKVRGKSISQLQIYDSVKQISGVRDVYALQMPINGAEKLFLFIETEATIEEINKKIVKHAPFLFENFEIFCSPNLPRSALGKVDRKKLQIQYKLELKESL